MKIMIGKLSDPEVFEAFKQDFLSWSSRKFFRLQEKLRDDYIKNQEKANQRYFDEHAQLSFDFDYGS